ncbi:ANTAR domain-containing protein [Actinomadura darangshiensis]|uniref:ANTAR domain-containing protein n=1 Tax=Actinomadura darangshiensis TaxID=705336 RepID=A0A4R5C154_9ACTN|nr:ANTAR domain-containing protein [Actinomadura darangshiensis]TDD90422.1 ANTAR domain-containing protein [Actinomadura darangshiensis]
MRAADVQAAIENLARADGASPPLINHVCLTCVQSVGAVGVCTSVRGPTGLYEPLCAVGPAGEALAELQVTVGEGPGWETVDGDRPVLIRDLDAVSAQRRWPLFAAAAAGLGTATVFAFPLLVGVVAVGALEIYWARRPLSNTAFADGLLFADAALLTLMTGITPDGDGADPADDGFRAGGPGDPFLDRWPQVHQAAGMVSVQLQVEPAEAYARLRAHAYANDQSLREVARRVVERTLTFSPDRDSE